MISRPLRAGAPTVAPHGGPRGGGADAHLRIDLSTNVNPYGAPPCVLESARAADVSAYPDPTSYGARAAAATLWRRPVDEIAFGAGVSELLPALFSAQLARGDTVVLATPLYGEYARTAQLVGARAVSVGRRSNVPHTQRLLAALRRITPRLLVIAAPGNPCGEAFTREGLHVLADAAAQHGCLLVIDQSYDAFLDVPLGDPALPGHPAVVHLRSLTKDFAIAGVRAAYVTAPAAIITAIEERRAPWSASSPAQSAAIASCTPEAQAHVRASTRALRAEVAAFAGELRAKCVGVQQTDVHWLLCNLSAAQATRLEQRSGIRVRTLDDHRLAGLARIVVPLRHQRAEVVDAIATVHQPGQDLVNSTDVPPEWI